VVSSDSNSNTSLIKFFFFFSAAAFVNIFFKNYWSVVRNFIFLAGGIGLRWKIFCCLFMQVLEMDGWVLTLMLFRGRGEWCLLVCMYGRGGWWLVVVCLVLIFGDGRMDGWFDEAGVF